MTTTRRSAVTLVVVLVAATSVGCSAHGPTEGSLAVGGGSEFTLCITPHVGEDRALGATYATNEGSSDITITSVELVDATGVEVGDAFAVLDDGSDDGYSVGAPVPPDPEDDAYSVPAWERRVDAEGAVIAPGETWQVIQVVKVTSAADAGFEALRIEYTEDGSTRVAQNTTRMEVEGRGAQCE